jgi:hypothetical protein
MAAPTTAELTAGDLQASALQRLRTALTAAGLIGDEVGRDGSGGQPSGPFSDGWLFAGFDNDGNPLRRVEGTGLSAITIQSRDSWAVNEHNTQEFPVLVVSIYTDCLRDGMGNVASRDADMRCRRIAKVVRSTFHLPAGPNGDWPGGVRVTSSLSVQDLSLMDIPDSDGAVRGVLRFHLALG